MITGILGIILSLVWFAVVYDSPEKNPHLSEKEQTIFEREGSKIKIASADVVSFTRWNDQLKRVRSFVSIHFFHDICPPIFYTGQKYTMEEYIDVTSCVGITSSQCNKVLGFCYYGDGDTSVFCWRFRT